MHDPIPEKNNIVSRFILGGAPSLGMSLEGSPALSVLPNARSMFVNAFPGDLQTGFLTYQNTSARTAPRPRSWVCDAVQRIFSSEKQAQLLLRLLLFDSGVLSTTAGKFASTLPRRRLRGSQTTMLI